MSISIHQVTKSFGQAKALDNVSLEIPGGELVALLGPSGCGKTTLLRIIAGLETADAGRIDYEGEDMTSVAAGERQVGFVFQHYALFRHMTVFDNIAFGLEVRGRPTEFIRDKVNSLLRLVRLENMGDRYPNQLSGGQRQRIALARALAIEPKVLLLDEPFGALDAKVRQELRQWLRRLHDELHTTSVFVTHDQEEAFEVSDQVVVMNHGQVEQIGSPFEVFEKPASQFVMDFLGHVNVFRGRLHDGRAVIGGLSLDMPDHPNTSVADATLYVRPHELEIERRLNGRPGLKAKVERVNPAGSIAKVGLSSAEQAEEIQVDLSRDRYEDLQLKIGEEVFIVPKRVRVFMPEYVI